MSHPLVSAFRTARGNQRTILILEPLYGIPYNLYTPFISIYMAQLGLSPVHIGAVATLNMLSQMLSSLFGGVIADKMGRRASLAFFDILCWCVPFLLWSGARSVWWFYLAAALNGMWRISNVSYSLLLAEGAEQNALVHLYALTNMASLLAGFLSPVAYLLMRDGAVVPTMRALYIFAFLCMGLKCFLVFTRCTDTDIALRRKAETRRLSLTGRLRASMPLLYSMLKAPRIMLAMGVTATFLVIKNVIDSFWPLFATDLMGAQSQSLSLFNMLRSVVMLLSTVFIVPHINLYRFKRPMLMALLSYVTVVLLYHVLPHEPWLLIPGTAVEAFSMSILIPLNATMLTASLDEEERARMLGFAFTCCLLLSSPFGLLAGWLSKQNRFLPLALAAAMAIVCAVCSVRLNAEMQKEQEEKRV